MQFITITRLEVTSRGHTVAWTMTAGCLPVAVSEVLLPSCMALFTPPWWSWIVATETT